MLCDLNCKNGAASKANFIHPGHLLWHFAMLLAARRCQWASDDIPFYSDNSITTHSGIMQTARYHIGHKVSAWQISNRIFMQASTKQVISGSHGIVLARCCFGMLARRPNCLDTFSMSFLSLSRQMLWHISLMWPYASL